MSLAMTEVDERVELDREICSTDARVSDDAKRHGAHPCFADSEFGNILRVLAEDAAKIEK
jgi:hypothetical protein